MNTPLEFSFVSDTFNLSIQDGEDGDRAAREMTEAERDKAEAAKRQHALKLEGYADAK